MISCGDAVEAWTLVAAMFVGRTRSMTANVGAIVPVVFALQSHVLVLRCVKFALALLTV